MNSLISTPAAFRVAGDKNEPFFKSPLGHGSLPPQPRRYSPPANNRLPGRMNRKRAASALSFDDPGVDRDENGTEGQEDAPGYNEEEHPVPLQVDKKKKEVKRGGSASKPGSTMTKAVRVSLPGSEEDEDEEDEGDLIGSSPANVDPDPHPDSPLPVPSVRIPKETLPDLFILPINEAAAKMGISVPQLKEACMEHGIIRWPFKKLSSLEVLIATVDAASKLQPGDPNATQMELVLQQLSGKGLLSKLREIKASILNHADFEVPIEVARLKQALNKSKKK